MTNKGVGFVGLGQMGRGMARNLSRDVSSFYVYDKLEGARKSLCDTDAILTDSLAYLSKNCDLIFLCLPSAKDVD